MSHDLSTEAAELIARLPDDFGQLTFPLMEELSELGGRIVPAMVDAANAGEAVLATAQLRGYSPDTRLADALTEAEQATYLDSQVRYLDAERAQAALDGWKVRAGAAAYGFSPSESMEPTVIQAPDGSLLMAVEQETINPEEGA